MRLDRSLPPLSAPGSRMEVSLPQQRLPQQRDHPNPLQAREGLILQNTECLHSAEQPQLLLSSSSAQPSTLLNSFQPRKLLSSAGTSPAKPAASRRRLSPGWRRLFWSVCCSFYLHSELCTGTGLGWKAWQLPAGWLPRVPGGSCRGKSPLAPSRCRDGHRAGSSEPPRVVPGGQCAVLGLPDCLAKMWDVGSRAGSGTLARILHFPGKVQYEPSATVPGRENLSLSMQVHLVSIYSKPKSSK